MTAAKRVPWWEIGGDTKPANDSKTRPCDGCQRIRCPEHCLYAPVTRPVDLIAAYYAAAAETFDLPDDPLDVDQWAL